MSSDEDADINRLRSDLIKSIRSKKSSRKASNTLSNSSPSGLAAVKSKASDKMTSAVLDTDIDDLEALRRAALGTLKKTKEASLGHVCSAPVESRPMPAVVPFPPGSAGSLFNQYPYHVPPPVLLGPSSSFSQFPAPPPTYQSRFFSQTAPGFRQLLRPMRSNLIVIQTMPRPEDQPRPSQPSTSMFTSGKLILPQDRYSKFAADSESGCTEKRKHDKWSRFDDSSSTSSSSSNSPVSSDIESDGESDIEEPSKRSDGASAGTPVEEDSDTKDASSDSGSTRDTPFEGVVIDESVSEQHTEDDDATTESAAGPGDAEEDVPAAQAGDSTQPRLPSSLPSEEDILLDEPEVEIEFLDEPVDEAIMQQLVADSPLPSETKPAPEPVHRQLEEQVTEAPRFKELKKNQLQSKYEAVKQQLEELQQKKVTGSSHRSSNAEDRKRNEKLRRHDERRSPSKPKADESGWRSRRDEERHQRHRSPGHKQLLSSVVAVSRHGGEHRDRSDAKRGVSSDYDDDEKKLIREHKAKRLRGHTSDNDGSSHSHRSPRGMDAGETVPMLPSAGEDLRKFLEKKKSSGPFNKSRDSGAKVDLSQDGSISARGSGKVISLKRSVVSSIATIDSTSPGNAERRGRTNGTIGGSDVTAASMPKMSVKDRISVQHDGVTKPKEFVFTKISANRFEIDTFGGGDASVESTRPVSHWRNSGAASREGTNSTGSGKKVKLRKRPY